jgi:hypothetical protein
MKSGDKAPHGKRTFTMGGGEEPPEQQLNFRNLVKARAALERSLAVRLADPLR